LVISGKIGRLIWDRRYASSDSIKNRKYGSDAAVVRATVFCNNAVRWRHLAIASGTKARCGTRIDRQRSAASSASLLERCVQPGRPAGYSTPGPTSDDASSASLHQYPMLPPSHRPGTIDCRLPPRRGRGRRALLQPGLPLPARPAGGGWSGLPQPRPGSRQLPQVVPGSLLAGRRTSLTPHHVRPHYIWLGACVDRDINIHARRPTGSPPASKFRSLLPSQQASVHY